jgi:DNA invertase Pin-like site-specific DNA recombinase
MVANVMASFAQFERRLIGQRTREALAVKRSQGIRLGRPRELSDTLRYRLARLRADGYSLAAIARRLNAEGVPTAQGGQRWHHTTVRAATET